MTPLIKKIALTSLIALSSFLLIIFVFGNFEPINTEMAAKPPVLRSESVGSLRSYEQVVSTNATRGLAEEIAKELIAQNPEGPQETEAGRQLASIDPEQLVQKALEETFSDLKIDDLRPIVQTTDLYIINSTDKELAQAYFNEITKNFELNFPSTLTINRADPTKTNFAAFLTAFDASIAALYKTTVPQTLAPLHRELITLLGAQRNAMALIKNYELDPAQAAIAIEAGDRFAYELLNLSQTMNAYAQRHGLKLSSS